ncbi:hypothetical protein PTD2_02846 [Pseudoalteromonas tunicata D2]|uniref:Uncharacterized protein n=1 Tax=Pseudoalteromonas tunicata D2 TaxID=87626 RepID=A4C4J0_9GAMM|nr:hypothetical protein PTD2_02846 [Pseudoalteromonas tunicata D2]
MLIHLGYAMLERFLSKSDGYLDLN